MGFFYMQAISRNLVESIFVAAALVATSVGITARVLSDAGVLETRAARVILAAAVVDDILGMIVLAVVSSLSTSKVNYRSIIIVAIEAAVFTALVVAFGSRVVGQLRPAMESLHSRHAPFILSIILCLGLSLASVYIGMAAIIGAFLAGLAMADHSASWKLQESAHPVYEFLAPFFFVLLGAQVNLRTISQPGLGSVIVIVCLLAVVSKVIGCGLGALSLG